VNVALLADFGSTFTKVLAVDLDAAVIAGRGQCPSGGDLMDGYDGPRAGRWAGSAARSRSRLSWPRPARAAGCGWPRSAWSPS